MSGNMVARLPGVISDAVQRGRLEFVLVLGGTNDVLRGEGTAQGIFLRLRQLHDIALRAPSMPTVGVLTLPPAKGLGPREHTRLELNRYLRGLVQQPFAAFSSRQ